MRKMPSKLRYVVLISCSLVTFIVIGFAIGLGVIFVELVNLLGISRGQMASMQSLCLGLIFAGSLISSPLIRRFGTTLCCVIGGFMATVSVLAASFLNSIPGLITLVGAASGFSLSFCHLASYATIREVFWDRPGFGEAVIMAGGGLGAFCIPMFNTFLLEEFGWRGTFLLLSGLLFNICLLEMITHTFKRICLQSDRCDKDVDVHSENGRKEEQTQCMDDHFENHSKNQIHGVDDQFEHHSKDQIQCIDDQFEHHCKDQIQRMDDQFKHRSKTDMQGMDDQFRHHSQEDNNKKNELKVQTLPLVEINNTEESTLDYGSRQGHNIFQDDGMRKLNECTDVQIQKHCHRYGKQTELDGKQNIELDSKQIKLDGKQIKLDGKRTELDDKKTELHGKQIKLDCKQIELDDEARKESDDVQINSDRNSSQEPDNEPYRNDGIRCNGESNEQGEDVHVDGQLVSQQSKDVRNQKDLNTGQRHHGQSKMASLYSYLGLRVFKKISFLVFALEEVPTWVCLTAEVFLLVDIVGEKGYDLVAGSYFLSAYSIASVFGNLFGGFLTSVFRIRGLVLAGVGTCCAGGAALGISFVGSFLPLMALMVLAGFLLGLLALCNPVIVLELVGLEYYATSLGLIFGITGCSNFISGPVGGTIRDVSGSYNLMLCGIAGVFVFNGFVKFFLAWLSSEQSYKEEERHVAKETVITRLFGRQAYISE
ncbi:uncharacterized protein LOC121378030 [Gigantopelta aegis]|uniref:uncharacterized protein LOC121378030 n=1 Tax=Gigantopelta aegis TaxID=1735272 RepID=UPI001B8879EA|nr:uncharacterized protein LOC121378030 [Gigantopelta aegis]